MIDLIVKKGALLKIVKTKTKSPRLYKHQYYSLLCVFFKIRTV